MVDFSLPQRPRIGDFPPPGQAFPVSALADEVVAGGLAFGRCVCSWCASLRGWCTNERFARQDFDDDHRCPAVRADEGWLDRFFWRIGISTLGFRLLEQLAAVRAPAQDDRDARHWRAIHSGGCGESRWAEHATGNGA